MPDPIVFRGLTKEAAEATAAFQRQQGATVEVAPDEGGLFAVNVTFPAAPQDQQSGGTNASVIIAACEAEWPAFQDDCSGFVRHVGDRLGVTVTGLANEIVNAIRGGDWQQLADGRAAKEAADAGQFVLGGLRGDEQTNPSEHGHVVVVVSGPLDETHNAYPTAYWGRLGGGGSQNETVNFAWRAGDRDRVTYAAKPVGG